MREREKEILYMVRQVDIAGLAWFGEVTGN